ncbi:MAG: DUF4332 domain-containing protein [Fuerstiella sp.]
MNLLFDILYGQKCTSTHHMLAMDALRYLRCPDHQLWSRLYLAEAELFLDGTKAPDHKFKDFRNHVLHVTDKGWGGAADAANVWYGRLVETLQQKDFHKAVYCSGVLSHYLCDSLMPLHTAQTEDESQVHRFIEWGTSQIYWRLVATHETARILQNWKPPESRASEDWLSVLVHSGAEFANQFYDTLIDHYDPAAGQIRPVDGFDDASRAAISKTLGWAIKATAFVIDQAIIESKVAAPRRSLRWPTVTAGLSYPIFWAVRKYKTTHGRKTIDAIWIELKATGKVIENLPEDDAEVRTLHAAEVLGMSLEELALVPVRRAGALQTADQIPGQAITPMIIPWQPASPVFQLQLDDDVVDAPSIGPKTSRRLDAIGIQTIADLVDANSDDVADQLDQTWIDSELVQQWQAQSVLMLRIPGLRGHDAQLLAAVGILRPEELQSHAPGQLLDELLNFADTDHGQNIISGSTVPTLKDVLKWQSYAEGSRTLRAA